MSPPEIRAAIAAAAGSIHDKAADRQDVLQIIAETARTSIPGFDHVGISTIDEDGSFMTRAAAGDLVLKLDAIQYELGEGPCVDSLTKTQVQVVPRLRHEQRWPGYVPRAVALGVRSQLAVRLQLDDKGAIGGLNLYSTVSDEIDPEAESLAELFAAHAAIALGTATEVENLNKALLSRKVIGQAIGLLMERYDIDADRAFAFLVRASSHGNIKLREIAERLVDEKNASASGGAGPESAE
jgi:GAF domain-containing protein